MIAPTDAARTIADRVRYPTAPEPPQPPQPLFRPPSCGPTADILTQAHRLPFRPELQRSSSGKRSSTVVNPHPENKGNETPWDVFKRGAEDGATHPGQTVGKTRDIVRNDGEHSSEEAGKKVDEVLEKVPVIGEALNITRVNAGQKNPDGSPVMPQPPNVQPDASESISPRPTGKAPGPPAFETSSTKNPNEQLAPSKTPSVASNASGKSAQPNTTGPQASKPGESESSTNTKSASHTTNDIILLRGAHRRPASRS